ncbi:MAG: S-layer homology domain-containing protein [Acidimicrobiia bacterium]|nr:S-layer homology domain-containing protein [Acidimicrobiia bacterium]
MEHNPQPDHRATGPPPTRRHSWRSKFALAMVAALVASFALASPSASQEPPQLVVEPDVAGIGESFLVGNAASDCDTEVSVVVDGLDLWAPDVQPVEGNWAVEFTVPTEDVIAATYEVNATCIVTAPEPGETFQYETAFVTVPPVGQAFVDVPEDHQFHEQITWMADSGIAQGYDDGTFHPDWGVSRQAMAAFLYRLAGSPYGTDPACTADQFEDVPVGHPFCGEIGWMVVEGITDGYEDLTFRPTDIVTRQAASAFIYRLSGAPQGADPQCTAGQFPDVPVEHQFCGEIAWMVDEGTATGYADGTFRPTEQISRQAAAAFLYPLAG